MLEANQQVQSTSEIRASPRVCRAGGGRTLGAVLEAARLTDPGDPGSVPRSERSPGERNGNLLQHSCLDNPMDRRAWQAMPHGVEKNQTHTHTHTHTQCLIGELSPNKKADLKKQDCLSRVRSNLKLDSVPLALLIQKTHWTRRLEWQELLSLHPLLSHTTVQGLKRKPNSIGTDI